MRRLRRFRRSFFLFVLFLSEGTSQIPRVVLKVFMSPAISFAISVPEPHSHLLAVEMRVAALDESDQLVLCMPVWTPGSYLIREYPKHVQEMEIRDADGVARSFEKIDKARWRVDVGDCDEVVVTYRVYGHELSPRYNHVDGTHAFFNSVATCMYPQGRLDEQVALTVTPPDGWEVFCGLDRAGENPPRYVAEDFDELFDTPVEMGPHHWFDFDVQGILHRFVVWNGDDIDMEALRRDLPTIVEKNIEFFGEIPYERYVFINHVARDDWGGLEHRHSSVNVFGPENFDRTERNDEGEYGEKYANLLRLWSHEHFHAYHVKRLRPEELGPFDYQRENHTRSLWAVEGVASYFDTYQLLGAGLIGPARYMGLLEKRIKQLHGVPGRALQSLEEASFDAWIDLYRRDENTPNASVSYYLKGELVSWLLDLWIRDQTSGEGTMADVLRRLWRTYYVESDVGFPRGAVEEAVSAEAGVDAGGVFRDLVRTSAPIQWEEFLAPAGLQLHPVHRDQRGWLAMKTKQHNPERVTIEHVFRGGPAERAGLYPGDEVVAVDGWSVRDEDPEEMIAQKAPGQSVTLHVFRRGQLQQVEALCEQAPPESYQLDVVDDASQRQLDLLKGWLGVTKWRSE